MKFVFCEQNQAKVRFTEPVVIPIDKGYDKENTNFM